MWNKRGLVTLCDGAKVNYLDVTAWFVKIMDEYQINTLWVGYDPWNAQYWVEEMQDTGFTMIEVRQGAKTMSNPMKQLEADLIENESGIAVLDQRAEFQEVKSEPVTLTKEQLTYTKENIYDYFNINEDIIRGKFTDDEWNAFFESVIEPLSIQLSLEFTNKIFSKESILAGHKIIFSVDRIQYAKTTTKITMLKELAILGLYTVDEARAILDMSPIGGEEGNKRVQTLNVINTNIADKYQSGKSEVDADDEE